MSDIGKLWRVVATSVTGFSHEAKDQPCQDSAEWGAVGDWVIAAVSDGAGSATLSQTGSRRLSAGIVKGLTHYLTNRPTQQLEDEIREVIHQTIDDLRDELSHVGDLADYSATLVGFIASPRGGWMFHIGDGIAVASDSGNWGNNTKSDPENGEYANETYFFTGDDWYKHLRLTRVGRSYNTWIAMSDGCMPFAMARQNQGLSIPFITPLHEFFVSNPSQVSESALADVLRRPQIRSITGDDKTLVWAYLENEAAEP